MPSGRTNVYDRLVALPQHSCGWSGFLHQLRPLKLAVVHIGANFRIDWVWDHLVALNQGQTQDIPLPLWTQLQEEDDKVLQATHTLGSITQP